MSSTSQPNPPVAGRLTGRVAYVLGGGAQGVPRPGEEQPMGNGRAIALRLAAEGAFVAVSDISREAADITIDAIRAAGGDGLALQTDARDPEACRQAVSAVIERSGRLDIVVCNVGIHGGLTVRRQTVEDWDRAFEINVRSHFFTAQAALEHMLTADSGVLIFVTSTAAERSSGTSAAYEASKAAQIAVMRSIAVRYGNRGIRSNALMLGGIDSGMVRGLFGVDEEAEAWRDAMSPAGRQGRPEEVAAAAAFLASDDASYINGATLPVDGGLAVMSAGFKR